MLTLLFFNKLEARSTGYAHYKNMGEGYTVLNIERIYCLNELAKKTAAALTGECLPISAKKAWRLGLIDKVSDKQHKIFAAQVKHLASVDRKPYLSIKSNIY